MPLFKRTPFSLLDPPKDLEANELVFQVRFTKEVFRDYQEYLKRLNLYRQRVWTCKATGKTNLTYEEALVSEYRAYEKVQQIPKELVGPVLHMIQYSTLSFTDLVDKIWVKMQEHTFEGLELHARKEGSTLPCRILKIITDGSTSKYEVGWLNREKKVTNTSILNSDDLVRKKPPLSRSMLRVFVKGSTSQNSPWVVHEDLAKKYHVPTDPPEEMKSKLVYQNGFVRCTKQTKRAIREDTEGGVDSQTCKRRKGGVENGTLTEIESVEYPIEDTLLEPSPDDPIFTKRPTLVRDFTVQAESVGYLLSVWNFCSSFGRLLHLSPFSLTDFANAICYKEGNAVLIVEVHAAIFYLLLRDEKDYFRNSSKKGKSKISLVNWTEHLCDFLEKEDCAALFSKNLGTIKRGHYRLLDTNEKLKILHELVEEALTTSSVREKLDEQIQTQTALRAANREEARKKKTLEDSEKVKMEQATSSDKVQVKGKDKERSSEKKPDEAQKEHLQREIEKLNIRTNPLGKDRDHSRYWFFRQEGRLFVESSDSKQWGYYSTKEELDALIGSLNPKGIRERALKRQLEKFYQKISTSLEKRTKEVNQKILLEEAVLRRSTRVRAQPKDNPAMSFLKYSNKWREA